MFKLSMFAVALALGTSAGLVLNDEPRAEAPGAVADSASNGAFRDGVYQAKLAVKRGEGAHISAGRWGSDADRASFEAGYRQGYKEAQ